ncbi:unnamed protein product [Absidia cylindrospora]
MSFISQQHYSPVSLLSIILPHHHSASTRTQQRQPHTIITQPLSTTSTVIITSLLFLFLPSPVASQTFINNGCLSLLNSTACHGFHNYYVGIPALARYGLNTTFSTIDDFDKAVENYTIGTRPYIADLGCYSATELDSLAANPNTIFPYARYSKSRICAALVQDSDSSLPCNNKINISPLPLCKSTCEQWLQSVDSIITNNTDVCKNTGLPQVTSSLNYLNSSCTDWGGFNGTPGYCRSGDMNEYNCGFSNSTNDACDYCNKNGSDECCQHIISCSSGLSVGAIIGIVVAVVVVLVGVGLGLFFFCFKRKKHIRKENSFSFKTYISPSTQHQQQQQQQQQLNAMGNNDSDHYSGNKVFLQNDYNNNSNNTSSNEIMGTMTTQSSQQTGHRSQLSDPFGDHYEVASLAANNNTTATATATNSESLQDGSHGISGISSGGGEGGGDRDGNGNGPAYEEEFYQVVHPYPPQVADELGLQVGDIVCLAMGFDDGWALGFNVTTGLKGVFPLVCVSLIPPSVLEQLLISSDNNNNDNNSNGNNQNDVMGDGLSTFSSKVLVEDDDSAVDQHSLDHRRLSRSSQLAISIRRIREDMRRSLSLSSSHRYPSPLSASNSISSRSIRPSSPSPSYLSHQNIPRRTASMVRNNNGNNNIITSTEHYAECDSPTSPTHQTPLFNDTNHHLHQTSLLNDSFEMYHHSSNRISKQES